MVSAGEMKVGAGMLIRRCHYKPTDQHNDQLLVS
jgi:hypothetical protein